MIVFVARIGLQRGLKGWVLASRRVSHDKENKGDYYLIAPYISRAHATAISMIFVVDEGVPFFFFSGTLVHSRRSQSLFSSLPILQCRIPHDQLHKVKYVTILHLGEVLIWNIIATQIHWPHAGSSV
jgi:hypothetical protein